MLKEILTIKKLLYKIIILSIAISLLFAYLAYKSEQRAFNPEFQNLADLLFFWTGMITTVGHGFSIMMTTEGKVFTSFAMLFGTFMYFAVFSEVLLAIKERYDSRFKGIKKYKGSGHVIIAGYNNLTLGLIHILDKMLKSHIDIVLLANNIDNNPDIDRIKFIHDYPATTSALKKANVGSAKLAVIMNNDENVAEKIDLNTIIVGAMIEELNREIHTIVELSFEHSKKDYADFKIDSTVSFEDLLGATRNPDKKHPIFNNLPTTLKEELFKEEFV